MTTPGPGGSGGPGEPGEDETSLDPGRVRRPLPGDDATTLDPGRRPRDPDDWGDSRLPPALAARFTFERELRGVAAQGALYLVKDNASGEPMVLKLYRENLRPDPQVWDWLKRPGGGGHVVRVTETDTASGRAYEVMEYLAGGDLYNLPKRAPLEVDPDLLAEVVRQVAPALADAHAAGIIHRDVKPGNILLRSDGQSPLDLALVDFGISTYVGPDKWRFNPTRSMSYRYAAPEWLQGGLLSAAVDWWALGMTIAELAGGVHPFEDWPEHLISLHLSAGRSINLSLVRDPRLALLCRGLLVRDPSYRWTQEQVAQWARGESPDVPDDAETAGPVPDDADVGEPFSYLGGTYWTPVELAVALVRDWDVAAGYFFPAGRRADRQPWRRLSQWLATLTDPEHDEASRQALVDRLTNRREPGDVKLLHLLRWLYPRLEPVYRTVMLTATELPRLAQTAIGDPGAAETGERAARAVIDDLWEHELLIELAGTPQGTGLADIDRRWRTLRRSWRAFAASRSERDPRLRQLLRDVSDDDVRCYLLWLAAAESGARRYLREVATATLERLAVPLPWFSDLAGPQASLLSLLCAALLAGVAAAEARRRLEDRRNARLRRRQMLAQRALDDWRRRQNRPLALGWAASGVAIVAAFWVWLIGLSDVLPYASEQAVNLAWIGVVLSLLAFGAAEIWLATVIGGPYHPGGYSLIGAGLSGAGRALRPLRRQGGLLLLIFGLVSLALVAATSYIPLVLPIACTAGEFIWVRARYRRYLADERSRAAALALAAMEFRAERRGLDPGI